MRQLRFLFLAVCTALTAGQPCRAAAIYTLTDLGKAPDGALVTFNAAGGVNPTLLPALSQTHTQAGIYSSGSQVTDPTDPFNYNQRALSLMSGGPTLPITPVSSSGALKDITTLAAAVNSSGTYVGTQLQGGGVFDPTTAIMFTRAGGTQAVPVPYVGRSIANSINDAGLIVGQEGSYAFLSDGKSSWDLNTLIDPKSPFLLQSATDINAAGQIVGLAYDNIDHTGHEYLLTPEALPTPEPSTLAVLGLGLVLIGAARRRARSRQFPLA